MITNMPQFIKNFTFGKLSLIKLFMILLCMLLLSGITSIAQPITWQRTYVHPNFPYAAANSICAADGNNFYVVGYAGFSVFTLKLNPLGDTLWRNTIDFGGLGKTGYASCSDGNGGCIVSGDGDTAFLANINQNGDINWYKNYSTRFVTILNILKTSDNGYIACGRKLGGDYHGYAIKTDSSGNLVWQKTYLSTEFKSYEQIVELDNGGCMLLGSVQDVSPGVQYVLMTRIGDSGEIIWEKRHSVTGIEANGRRIIKIQSGFLISGSTPDSAGSGANGYLMKTDTSGNKLFEKRLSSDEPENLTDIKLVNSNKLLITLIRYTANAGEYSRVLITDSLGVITKEKSFSPGSYGYIYFNSIMLTANGDYIFAGLSELDSNSSNEKCYVARTDSNLFAPPIGVITNNVEIVKDFKLYQNYPNPFNPLTKIEFELAAVSYVKLSVFDVAGRTVAILLNGVLRSGKHQVELNSSVYNLSSGVYFVRLEPEKRSSLSIKIIVLK